MRKLMWFSMGFASACGIYAYFADCMVYALPVSVLLLLSGGILMLKGYPFRIMVVLALGLCLGLGWCLCFQEIRMDAPAQVDGQRNDIIAEALDYGQQRDYGVTVEARLHLDGQAYRAMLYVYDDVALEPGDQISGTFSLRYTANDEPTYHRGNGIYLLAYSEGNVVVEEANGISVSHWPAVLRQKILSKIDQCFPQDVASFCKALLLGERSELDYSTDVSFQRSGISHIVAVSGLHISMLMAGFYLLLGKGSALLAVPFLFLFSAMAGFTPSITRACLMHLLFLLSNALKRQYDAPTALGFAVLFMLAVNPLVITSVGFQLSVGSVAGIFLFASPLYQRLRDLPFWAGRKGRSPIGMIRNWICASISVTLGAVSLTTPLIAVYFGNVSILSVLTNLLVLFPVNITFCGIAVVSLLSFLLPTVAAGLGWTIAWIIRLILWISGTISALPFAAVYVSSGFIVAWLAFSYVLFAVFLLDRHRRVRIFLCCSTMTLCMCLMLSWLSPRTGDTVMTMLDVGQGQCVLISSHNRHFLVDCGGDYDDSAADAAYAALQSRGIFRLDGMIVTHYDDDHAGGVPLLCSIFPVEQVYLADVPDEGDLREEIQSQMGNRITWVKEDLLLQWDECKLQIFAPVLSNSDNESGITVLFSAENCDILITGDLSIRGENVLVKEKQLPRLDVLVVGHHGANNSTGDGLLEATRPEYAFISVGADNSYGHPKDAVLQRLNEFGCKVYRTDEHGTITFRR